VGNSGKKKQKPAVGNHLVSPPVSEALEKRDTVLFSRVTQSNKEFISQAAASRGVSESVFVNYLASFYRANRHYLDKAV
jgi:uncharacterized protein (DUF1778 family)